MTDVFNSDANPLRDYFERNPGRMINKWMHYFDAYHRHFARFRGQPITLLEIGIYHGGSMQMWRDYFGPAARIIGVDIDPRVTQLAEPGIEIIVGDQSDRAFLQDLARRLGPIDILIDDGGHKMSQQIATLEELYGSVAPNGVILVEDTHTSYWREYDGGVRVPFTFMNYIKYLVDELNAWHSRDPYGFFPSQFTRTATSMHFYDSIVVIEKGAHEKPIERTTGNPSFPLTDVEKKAFGR